MCVAVCAVVVCCVFFFNPGGGLGMKVLGLSLGRILRFDWQSPLGLRRTIRILSGTSDRPYLTLLRLLWPIPWYFPCDTPDPPRALQSAPEIVSKRYRHIYKLRLIPLWRARDTPLRSFYRIYEAYCADDDDLVGFETEYFWKRSEPGWATELIPDPKDPDPERYAVMATLAEQLVEAFNWRLRLGKRRNGEFFEPAEDGTPVPFVPEACPTWVEHVPPLDELLVLHDWRDFSRQDPSSGPYKRNVKAASGALMTV